MKTQELVDKRLREIYVELSKHWSDNKISLTNIYYKKNFVYTVGVLINNKEVSITISNSDLLAEESFFLDGVIKRLTNEISSHI